MLRTLLAAAVTAAALLAPVATAPAPAPATTVQVVTAATSSFGTLAQRNRYIGCVAPGTEVGYTLRVNLLRAAARALEGIRAGVPDSRIVRTLQREFPQLSLTSREGLRIVVCTRIVWAK